MSKINLLPWRHEISVIKNRRFYALSGLVILFGICCVILAHMFIVYRIGVENNNISYIQKQLAGISGKVTEVKGLQQNKQELLNRMAVIQALQKDRVLVVQLLDMIPRTVPEGVFLKSINRVNDDVIILGNARTNSGASIFLLNLENPKWARLVIKPKLTDLQAVKEDNSLNFNLQFTLGKG